MLRLTTTKVQRPLLTVTTPEVRDIIRSDRRLNVSEITAIVQILSTGYKLIFDYEIVIRKISSVEGPLLTVTSPEVREKMRSDRPKKVKTVKL